MISLLRREQIFLHRSLSGFSRFLLLLGAGALVMAAFLPLWRIRLVAPQYQEGLEMHIYSYKLVGGNSGQDLKEINQLNHYIGMKAIEREDFFEMRWVPFALGVFVLLALRGAVLGSMLGLVDLLVLFLYFSLFSLGSFYFRLYTYGHQLDPHAPVHMNSFTPILVGTQQIANFVQSSWPDWGSLFLALLPILCLAAMALSRNQEP